MLWLLNADLKISKSDNNQDIKSCTKVFKSANIDLIVHEKLVVDTKVIDRITDHELGQMMNYLKITNFKAGLILNFKKPKLEWKRVVL